MAVIRKLLVYLAVGALLGTVVASLVGPGLLTWYNTPAQGQALCSCAEMVKSTATSLLWYQFTGACVGAGLFLLLGIVLTVRGRKSLPPGSTTTASGTPELPKVRSQAP